MTPEEKRRARLALFNRQPTLWRHGIAAVEIIPADNDEDDTIGVGPLTLEPYNMDFDGDTAALYVMHEQQSLNELENNAFIKNTINYDVNNKKIAVVRHEALYAAYILTEHLNCNENDVYCMINDLSELPETYELYNHHLSSTIEIKSIGKYPYGICLINKWCGFDSIKINKTIVKKYADYLSNEIYEYYKDNTKYYDALTQLNKNLLFFISTTEHCPSLNVDEMLNILDKDTSKMFRKIPEDNIPYGYLINETLVDRCINNIDKNSHLYKLYKSGSRFSRTQLARSCINIGFVADASNTVIPKPIKSNLIYGVTPDDFFMSSPGTRKGIADKSTATPQSGHLERTLAMGLSPLEIIEEDCESPYVLETTVFSEKHAQSLIGKYYYLPESIQTKWKVLNKKIAYSLINRKIWLRSPMLCQTPHNKLCRKCFGTKPLPTNYVGIVAAQSVAERITQLTMRSFHTSGSANIDIDEHLKMFVLNHLVDINGPDEKNITKIIFDTDEIPPRLFEFDGFHGCTDNIIYIKPSKKHVINKDAISVISSTNLLMNTHKEVKEHPHQYYEKMMAAILEVGVPYSSFIEMVFANMFMCDEEYKTNSRHVGSKFWRYNPDSEITRKHGVRTLPQNISALLGVLYTPNKDTLKAIANGRIKDNGDSLNIYEKVWRGLF